MEQFDSLSEEADGMTGNMIAGKSDISESALNAGLRGKCYWIYYQMEAANGQHIRAMTGRE